MRKGLMILALGVFLLSGCAGLDLVLLAGEAALTATDVNTMMKRMDYSDTIQADFDKVWAAAKVTVEGMGIKISEEKLHENGNSGTIIGKTADNKKIQVLVSVTTPVITTVGIKTRKGALTNADFSFAVMIFEDIVQRCQKTAEKT